MSKRFVNNLINIIIIIKESILKEISFIQIINLILYPKNSKFKKFIMNIQKKMKI